VVGVGVGCCGGFGGGFGVGLVGGCVDRSEEC
jgi:hypothetical protein